VLAHFPLPGDAVTLIPARDSNGAQIPGGKVYPALVVADEWAGLVPAAHKTPLADPVVRAHQPLASSRGLRTSPVAAR
jgi:hypothetical protein